WRPAREGPPPLLRGRGRGTIGAPLTPRTSEGAMRRRRSRHPRRAAAVAVALLADRLLGEPPLDPHPVAAFGDAMTRLEGAIHADDERVGAAYTAIGTLAGATAGAAVSSTIAARYLSLAGRALAEAAHAVAEPLALGDLDEARRRLPALVGRDARHLDAGEIARA